MEVINSICGEIFFVGTRVSYAINNNCYMAELGACAY